MDLVRWILTNHATGHAIIIETITQITYSRDNRENISIDFAPLIFLIPISFVLRSVMNEDNPMRPRHEITIARRAK